MGDLLGGSFRVAEIGGVPIRIHVLFVLWIGFGLLQAKDPGGELLFQLVLFGSVLLHELGHVAGARAVGGDASEVILWPLGGLTSMRVPRTAKAEWISTAAGPAVNLLLAALGLAVLAAIGALAPAGEAGGEGLLRAMWHGSGTPLGRVAGLAALVNGALFLFNVLPAYPMDGGRILRATLWPLLGWRTATILATGAAIAFGVGFIGLGLLAGWGLFLPIIGLIVVMHGWRELQVALETPPWSDRMPFERRDDAPRGP